MLEVEIVVFTACYHRNYIDQLEQPGGKHYNIQNFMMMYIFGSTTNTHYRTKLFDHWPTVSSSLTIIGCKVILKEMFQYLEDFNECKAIMGYRFVTEQNKARKIL